MSDKDKNSTADRGERSKKGSMDAAILGGFKSSSKRFAEYRQNGTDSGTWKTVVVPDMANDESGRVPSKREWLERLFQLFDQYSQDFNKLVDEPHLISACYPPREHGQENALINEHQGLVSTKHWELVVRLLEDGVSGYLLPKAMEENFLTKEHLFERIFFIECVGEEAGMTWIFDGRTTEFSQLPSLARRCFGSLIEIARKEEASQFEDYPAAEPTIPLTAIDEAVGRRVAREPLTTNFPSPSGNADQFVADAPPEFAPQEFVNSDFAGTDFANDGFAKDEFAKDDFAKDDFAKDDFHLGASTSFGSDSSATTSEDLTGFKDLLSFGQSQSTNSDKEQLYGAPDSNSSGFYDSEHVADVEPSGLSGLLKENDSNTEEIEMLKMEDGNITAALEMMKHSVDKELESITKAGARAFENQDMSAVEKAMKRTKRVKEFKDQLGPVLALWERLESDED